MRERGGGEGEGEEKRSNKSDDKYEYFVEVIYF